MAKNPRNARQNTQRNTTRKVQSSVKKASPIKAGKNPVSIEVPAAGASRGPRKRNGAKPASPAAPADSRAQLTQDQIAARAYLIWEAKGRPNGCEHDNWCEAEAQLRKEMGS